MRNPQYHLDIHGEITVDLFAGGGGMSVAWEMALGRSPDIAVNHDEDALSMHEANHPQTIHYQTDVFEVCPRRVTQGRPVGLLHLSPDCTHHSQAAAGQPRKKKMRSLTWVALRWVGQVRPRIMTLENVVQIANWGPLVAKRDRATGRVVKQDGTVAARGERVPVQEQFLVPDKKRLGRSWRRFIAILKSYGYAVEFWPLVSADYGAATSRKRLFLVARCDGKPIVRPKLTHAAHPRRDQKPYKTAADIIDWSIPTVSIFGRKRPLVDKTLTRIASGVVREVLNKDEPYIAPNTAHGGATQAATMVQTGYGERKGQAPRVLDIQAPLGTCVAGGVKHAIVSAYMAQMNGGRNTTPGHDLREPLSAITNSGSQQQLVTAHLATLRQHCNARSAQDVLPTIAAGGEHHALITSLLSKADVASPLDLGPFDLTAEQTRGALRVAAFLMRYYSEGGQWGDLREPLDTVTTRDRLALVTVVLLGVPYVIVDIGLRMMTPHELYRAQGFYDRYIIDRGHDGRVFSKAKQVRMVGNSVSPPPAAALLAANAADLAVTNYSMAG